MNSRNELPQFFKERGYKTGAEIGVLRGEFTEQFCQEGIKMYAIDTWENYLGYRGHPKEEPQAVIYETAKRRLAPYGCVLIKKSSMDALNDFKDRSLDFVYIDGNHALPFIINDIYWWFRKVKNGGILAGHDYELNGWSPYQFQVCHVKYAVDLCAEIFGMKTQVLNRDKHPSWMWIKA